MRETTASEHGSGMTTTALPGRERLSLADMSTVGVAQAFETAPILGSEFVA